VPASRQSVLASYICALIQFAAALHFSYLEINPLVVVESKDGDGVDVRVLPLDMAARVDETAKFECGKDWGRVSFVLSLFCVGFVSSPVAMFVRCVKVEFPAPFGRKQAPGMCRVLRAPPLSPPPSLSNALFCDLVVVVVVVRCRGGIHR
jgi:ATP citrate (pro-S)-lyase